MSYLIALDDGHGLAPTPTPGKRTPPIPQLGGRVVYENEFNREVVKYLNEELKRCGFRTILVAPTDEDTPLKTRVGIANANDADLYVSCHYNAATKDGKPVGEGLETWHYTGSVKGKRAAELIHKHLMNCGIPRRNRGVKNTTSFYVLKYTKMPAVLIEYGFMTDPDHSEAIEMLDPKVQKTFAVATAKGICEYFGVKYVPEQNTVQAPTSTTYEFYDCVVDDADRATFSARNPDEIGEKVKELIRKQPKKITLYRRK